MCVCVFVCDPAVMREKEGRGRARRIIRVTGFTIPTTGSDGGHLSVGSVTQVVTLHGCSGANFFVICLHTALSLKKKQKKKTPDCCFLSLSPLRRLRLPAARPVLLQAKVWRYKVVVISLWMW